MSKYSYKPKNPVNIINLAARMDTRSNFVVLDNEEVNQTGLVVNYLQNADLFYTKALASRNGSQDVCGGIIGSTTDIQQIRNWNTVDNTSLSGSYSLIGQYLVPTAIWNQHNIPGMLWIQQADQNIISANFGV